MQSAELALAGNCIFPQRTGQFCCVKYRGGRPLPSSNHPAPAAETVEASANTNCRFSSRIPSDSGKAEFCHPIDKHMHIFTL